MQIVSRQTLKVLAESPDYDVPGSVMYLTLTYKPVPQPPPHGPPMPAFTNYATVALHRRRGFNGTEVWMPATLDDDLQVRKQLDFEWANRVKLDSLGDRV